MQQTVFIKQSSQTHLSTQLSSLSAQGLLVIWVTGQFAVIYLLDAKALLEAVTQRCSVKKVSLEISQNSQENTCARDSC